jgi:tetratricopeptide (TPR) repeat protein
VSKPRNDLHFTELKIVRYKDAELLRFRETPLFFRVYHPNVAISYDNIGLVYSQLGDCLKGLAFYEKALGAKQKSPSFSYTDFATSRHLIGSVYEKMGNYAKATLLYHWNETAVSKYLFRHKITMFEHINVDQ